MAHPNEDSTEFPTNEELIAFRKKHFLPAAPLYHKIPLQLVKAQGVHVWDSKGKQYLDAIGGIVCISAGHNHPRIKKALMQAMEQDTIQHTSVIYLNQNVVEASKRLLEEAPAGLDRVAFVNSGSEANELAFMAARHSTGEAIIINLRHSYHGGTAATLAACGQHTWRFGSQPLTSVVPTLEPYCYRCPVGKTPTSCSIECAKNVETTIQTSTHGKLAAMIVEPVMGVGGFITPPDDYFGIVAKIVHSYGGKLIIDEVQTGAGRTSGSFLLSKDLKIDADMVTMAKGLGNGAAVGAVLMKSDVAEKLAGKVHFNTFGGDPYQMIQTKLTLDIIKEEKLTENSQKMGKLLRDGLSELQKSFPIIGDVRGRGLLMGIELVKDPVTKAYATDECVRLMDLCKDQGVLFGKGGLFGNVLRIAPPLSINEKQVNQILEAISNGLHTITSK